MAERKMLPSPRRPFLIRLNAYEANVALTNDAVLRVAVTTVFNGATWRSACAGRGDQTRVARAISR